MTSITAQKNRRNAVLLATVLTGKLNEKAGLKRVMAKKYITLGPKERENSETKQELSLRSATERCSQSALDFYDYPYWDYNPPLSNLTCYESELQFSGLFDHRGFRLFRCRNRIGFI